jgi:hypothetical protein
MSLGAAAADAAQAGGTSVGRPDADAGPTRVYVTLWVADIDTIDSARQNFTANVYVGLRWTDRRLTHAEKGPKAHDLNSIWNPRAIVTNEIGLVRRTLPEMAEVEPDGTVTYRQRYVGVFSQKLRLEDFPLDSHAIQFRLASPGYTTADIEYVPDARETHPIGPYYAPGAGVAEDITLPDFSVTGVQTMASPYVTGSGPPVAGYALEFQARRHGGYFVWKVLLPLVLIVLMSWLVFWVDPANVGTQIGMATTAMLTLIAYRSAIDDSVPRVGYLTRMDYFIIGSSILVFLALCQVIVTAYLQQTGRRPLALRCDWWARIAYMVLLLALLSGSFAA